MLVPSALIGVKDNDDDGDNDADIAAAILVRAVEAIAALADVV